MGPGDPGAAGHRLLGGCYHLCRTPAGMLDNLN